MKKTTLLTFIAIASLALAFTSCAKSTTASNLPKEWLYDFDAAKTAAVKQNKDIFLLFSGDDWDGTSEAFKKNVVSTKEFTDALKARYVFVNVDFSQTEYGKTDLEEDASKKQKKEAERIEAEYAKKEELARNYDLQQYPCAYLLSSEGFVLSMVPYYETIDTPAAYLEEIDGLQNDVDSYSKMIQAVRSASGVDRARAIQELYESTGSSYLGPLEPLVREVPLLDPENETGAVGNFVLYAAYFDAYDCAAQNDVEGAMQVFADTAENKFLDQDQKQNAWYMAAYMLAAGGSYDYGRIESLLQKAYDIDPQGEHSESLMEAIEKTREMAENAASYEALGLGQEE